MVLLAVLRPALHKKVALEAAERHESMNTYVMKQLGLVDAPTNPKECVKGSCLVHLGSEMLHYCYVAFMLHSWGAGAKPRNPRSSADWRSDVSLGA